MGSGDGLGGLITGMFGSSNDYSGPNPQEDPSHFQWGGSDSGAADRSKQLQALGQGYAGMQGANVDTTQSGFYNQRGYQVGQSQDAYNTYLQQLATGTGGPTAADAKMQAGTDAAIKAQMAGAASARGGGSAGNMAQYSAGQNAGQIEAQNAQAAAQLRAQEQQQAQQLYAANLQQQRAQELQSQGMSAQQAQYQAGLQQQSQIAGMQGQLQAEGLSNQTQIAQLNAYGNQEALQQGVAQQNAQMNQTNATGLVGTAAMAVGALAAMSDAGQKTDIRSLNGWGSGDGGWGGVQNAVYSLSQKDTSADTGDQVQKLDLSQYAPKSSSSGGGMMSGIGSMMGGMMGGSGGGDAAAAAAMSDEREKKDLDDIATTLGPKGRKASTTQMQRGAYALGGDLATLYGVGSTGAAEASAAGARDAGAPARAAKSIGTDVGTGYGAKVLEAARAADAGAADVGARRGGGGGPIDSMLERVRPVSFEYRHPEIDGGGRQYGVLAQDLERSPMGASMVVDTPRGKMVDTRKASLAGIAALADHQERLDRLENTVMALAGPKRGK